VLIRGWETEMVKKRVMFTFPQEHVREPIIHTLGNQFQLVTNIHRADISEDKGWVVLELEGSPEEIERGIAWATARGVRVDPAIGDGIEG
jgi:ABC-type methionine transport system ATPase subunit